MTKILMEAGANIVIGLLCVLTCACAMAIMIGVVEILHVGAKSLLGALVGVVVVGGCWLIGYLVRS